MNKIKDNRDYMKFRWFFTSSGKLVVGGKSDELNERVLREYLNPKYVVCHTSEPGSPFMIIVSYKIEKKILKRLQYSVLVFQSSGNLEKR